MVKEKSTDAGIPEKKYDGKFYTKGSVAWCTFLGGPLGGCYLLGKNFQVLGSQDAARNSFIGGIVSTLTIILFIIFTPESIIQNIPNSLLPIIYTTIIYSLLTQYQEKYIQGHLKAEGERYSSWKATGIGLLSLIILLVVLFAIVLSIPETWIG